jgi:hypothetical protein
MGRWLAERTNRDDVCGQADADPSPSATPPAVAGPVAAVNAGAGNAAVARMVVQRTPLTDAARTPSGVKAVPTFAGVDDLERARLINILLDQLWVGPDDELALESIWRSLGNEDHLVSFIEAFPGLFEKCVDRGADLTEVRPYRDIRTHFTNDIIALARRYLPCRLWRDGWA